MPDVAIDRDADDLVAVNDILDESEGEGEGDSETPSLKPLIQVQLLNRGDAAAADNDDSQATASLADGSMPDDSNKRAWGASPPPETTVLDDEVNEAVDKEPTQDVDEPKRPWGLDEAADAEERGSTADSTTSDSAESVESSPLLPASKDPNSKRMWGTASAENATKAKSEATPQAATEAIKMPFATSMRKDLQSHIPPDGFKIKARVYIDPADKLAHLSMDLPHVPYWDCGVTGSTYAELV